MTLVRTVLICAGAMLASVAAGQIAYSPDTAIRFQPRIFGDRPSVDQMAELGRRIFFDPALSASGKLACVSCHSPVNAYGPPNNLPVQFGGAKLDRAGTRAAPSLRYLSMAIPFTEHFIDDDDGHGDDAGPTGGFTWDGRVNSLHEQAAIPLLAKNEMANSDVTEVARRIGRSGYAALFRDAFSPPGRDVFADPQQVFNWVGAALEVFLQSPTDFSPFTSKFDAFLRRQVQLSDQEMRGFIIFNDSSRGNCAGCHPATLRASGAFPLFTDFSYAALGAPRNRRIPANRDPRYYDLGLCGRPDLKQNEKYCGMFKTPSLRNVALRSTFFHNGVFKSLKEVLQFYATRDIDPERWYGRDRQGHINKYNDLPARYRANVNAELPFGARANAAPILSEADIADLAAFLLTLTDGFVVQNSGSSHLP